MSAAIYGVNAHRKELVTLPKIKQEILKLEQEWQDIVRSERICMSVDRRLQEINYAKAALWDAYRLARAQVVRKRLENVRL